MTEPHYLFPSADVAAKAAASVTLSTLSIGNSAEEQLCEAPRLPATIVRQPPVRIDTVLTKEEFRLLVRHMMNGNPESHFLVSWRDDEGVAHHAKANARKHRGADNHADWAYDSTTGKAKRKTSIGCYPKNETNHSTWGAFETDGHAGGHDLELALERAGRAFSIFLKYQDRYLIMSASGRGYHVFVFSREQLPLKQWTHLLEDTAQTIGAPIQDGVCEIRPDEKTERQETGRAIRVPGTINPATGEPELVMAETIRPLIDFLKVKENDQKPPTSKRKSFLPGKLLLDKEVHNSYYKQGFAASTERLIEEIILKYPIKRKSTRNGVLLKLIGELKHKFGRKLSEYIVRLHYKRYEAVCTDPIKGHMAQFDRAWVSILNRTVKDLLLPESRIFGQLQPGPQQEAFMLCRSFSKFKKEFPLPQVSLADRLSISQPGAGYVISKLIQAGAIEKVSEAKTHSRSACYTWTAAPIRKN
jgi:hypothetical protein